MNIFILNTGRCGSTTFIEACRHITNYSAGHETRTARIGEARFDYADNHIEADNRLSWFLGRLDRRFGDDAAYVHLRRDDEATARSFVKRFEHGIIKAYWNDVLMGQLPEGNPLSVSLDYCETVNENIRAFLKGKSRKMDFRLENATQDFARFWEFSGAEGDFERAAAEWETRHNAS